MKENVLDVLMYLFQNYMDGEFEVDPDRETLQIELAEAGFPLTEIHKAFDWLDDLAASHDGPIPSFPAKHSIRLYTDQETEKLDMECRGFLLYLEHTGVINPITRELIMDRVMALDSSEIDIERLKWVILMVLFNQPDQDFAYEWIENMVFEQPMESIH